MCHHFFFSKIRFIQSGKKYAPKYLIFRDLYVPRIWAIELCLTPLLKNVLAMKLYGSETLTSSKFTN